AGTRLEGVAPTGEVETEPIEIALRSSMPDGGAAGLRLSDDQVRLPPSSRLLAPLGVIVLLLGLAPLGAAALANRRARRASEGQQGVVRRDPARLRAALDEIRGLDAVGDADARAGAFDRLDAIVREAITDAEIPAEALTPDEIETRLRSAHASADAERLAGI